MNRKKLLITSILAFTFVACSNIDYTNYNPKPYNPKPGNTSPSDPKKDDPKKDKDNHNPDANNGATNDNNDPNNGDSNSDGDRFMNGDIKDVNDNIIYHDNNIQYTHKFDIPNTNYSVLFTHEPDKNRTNVIDKNSILIENIVDVPDTTFDNSGSTYVRANSETGKLEFDYANSKKNNDIFKANIKKDFSDYSKAKLNVFELNPSYITYDTLEKTFPTVKINVDKYDLKKGKSYHGANVVKSMADTNGDGIVSNEENENFKSVDLTFNNESNRTGNRSATGIISMSYGYPDGTWEMSRLHPNASYLDKVLTSKLWSHNDYFSNTLFFKEYVNNAQLRVRSLGNDDFVYNNKYFNNGANLSYMAMSPEVQKMARNDVILTKDIFSENTLSKFQTGRLNDGVNAYNVLSDDGRNIIRYFEPILNSQGNDAKPLNLRSFTVATEGLIEDAIDENSYAIGSSFAAPKVARLAYDIKKKFPFMSYNQIKQTILTTAKKDDSGYLNDIVGWGIVDRNKAMKGPSDFNAGLIEEEKYYAGNLDKIFENYKLNENNHNVYFYANINDGESYTFSNNITSGLKGDGNNKDYIIYDTIGNDKGNSKDPQRYRFKVPKVLDSERNYYANIKKAGLRKDGKGTLVLEGKQLYDTNTEVLDGVLDLRNDSNSKYLVFDKGTLLLGDKKAYSKNKTSTINIYNSIVNDGDVEFNSNVNLFDYKASKNSKTKINIGDNKITANEFLVNGDIYYKLTKDTTYSQIKNVVKANKVDFSHAEFKNPFLKPIVMEDGLYEKVNGLEKSTFPKLKSLTDSEKRNLPSYDDNSKKFFTEYTRINPETNYVGSQLGNYLPHYEQQNKVIKQGSTEFNLLNFESDSLDKANSELFTDNYTNIIASELNTSNEIRKIVEDASHTNLTENDLGSIKYTSTYIRNIVDNPKFSKLNSSIYGNIISSNVNAKVVNLNLGAGYMYGNGKIHDNNGSINTFNNHIFTGNFGLNKDINNFNLKYNFTGSYNLTNGVRYMQDNPVLYNLKSYNLVNTLGVSYTYKNKLFEITPSVNYTNTIYKVHKFEEVSNEKNKPYLMDIKNNTIVKHNIDLGVDAEVKFGNTSLLAGAKVDFNLNPKTEINVDTLGVSYKANVPTNKAIKGEFELGIKHLRGNHIFETKGLIDTNLKGGVSASYEFKF